MSLTSRCIVSAALLIGSGMMPGPAPGAVLCTPAQTRGNVSTTYRLPQYPRGDLYVKFEASPVGDGTWDVSATVKAHNVSQYNSFLGYTFILKGTGTGSVNIATGVSGQLVASGLYWVTSYGYFWGGMNEVFTITVDNSGVVTLG